MELGSNLITSPKEDCKLAFVLQMAVFVVHIKNIGQCFDILHTSVGLSN